MLKLTQPSSEPPPKNLTTSPSFSSIRLSPTVPALEPSSPLTVDLQFGPEGNQTLGIFSRTTRKLQKQNLPPHFPTRKNSSTLTSTREQPNTTEKTSVGTSHSKSGDISTIERFTSVVLAPLKNLARKIWNRSQTRTVTKITIPSEWTSSLQKQLNLHPAYSTTSPVVLVPLVPHPLHYQGVSAPRKLATFLRHPYP